MISRAVIVKWYTESKIIAIPSFRNEADLEVWSKIFFDYLVYLNKKWNCEGMNLITAEMVPLEPQFAEINHITPQDVIHRIENCIVDYQLMRLSA